MHKREIRKIAQQIKMKHLTFVPIKAYFNNDNRLKLVMGLARGKNVRDKRDDIKERDTKKAIERGLKNLKNM